jgi:hypothetical protein
MAVLLVLLFLAVALALAFALGVAWIVVAPVLVALALGAWATLAFTRRSPRTVVNEAEKPELLGPGGPDDPNAGR